MKSGIKRILASLAMELKRLQNKELDAIAVHDNQVERLSEKMGFKWHGTVLYTRGYFIVFSRPWSWIELRNSSQSMAKR